MIPENTIVKLTYDSGYVAVKTFDRTHHGSIRFLIDPEKILRIMNDPMGGSAFDADCGNFVEVWQKGSYVWFRFVWLSSYGDNSVTGFTQHIYVPADRLDELLDIHTPITFLCKKESRGAKVHNQAHHTVANVLSDSRKRRALSKAMRDCFQWQGDEVTLWDDGGDNFFFVTKSGFPKNGGLILHESTHNGYPCIFYSVHT